MAYQTENTIDKRKKRISDVIALKEPDRVPFAPKTNLVFAQDAGVSMYEALMDFNTMIPGVEKYLSKYEVDLYWGPAGYPSNVMEVLDTSAINWPGPTKSMPRDQSFQIVDKTYMEEDEYDELINDPSKFFMTKIFPRRHNKLNGLSKITFDAILEMGHYAGMASFSDPEVRESLLTLMFAGEQSVKWLEAQKNLEELANKMQAPSGCVVGQTAPYDMLADGIRGYLNVPMDIFEIPDKVLAAIDVMTNIAMKNIHDIKARGIDMVFMPLHGGTDDFMGKETYEKFYWPSLSKLIHEIIRLDMTPYIFFEGKYDRNIELTLDVPKGKCIYMYEQVDIVRAKKIVGDTACITGNIPGSDLVFGKKEDVIEKTKRMLDACAPGGGFIMDCSLVLDTYNEELWDAWYETTMKYGKY